jgi:hypothetical protein
MNDEELEAYLRKHTFNGAMRELHDAWAPLKQLLLDKLSYLVMGMRIAVERIFEWK